ncbi:hypothetical protein YC2023_033946 [Brassica napus]
MGLDGAEASHKIHHPVLMHLSAFISLETKARVLRRSGSRDNSFWVLEKVCSHGLELQQSLISGSLGSNLLMKWNIFKMFNMQFDELHQRQFLWTVPYTELTEPLVESWKNSQRYIKYTAEDL